MTHLTPRQRNIIPVVVLMLLIFSAAAYTLGAITGPKYTFYDGEGEIIPYRAVDSLVRGQFMERSFSKAGRDTVAAYFPVKNGPWHGTILYFDDQKYTAIMIRDSTNDFEFVMPHKGRFQSTDGDTSLLQVLSCTDPLWVSTKDSAQIAIDRWNKIYNHE